MVYECVLVGGEKWKREKEREGGRRGDLPCKEKLHSIVNSLCCVSGERVGSLVGSL